MAEIEKVAAEKVAGKKICLLSAAALVAVLGYMVPAMGQSAGAPVDPRVKAASGLFEMIGSKGPNTCQLMLRPEGATNRYELSVPYGCRKAFPITLKVDHWSLGDGGLIRLNDAKDNVVVEFAQKDEKLRSVMTEGAQYELRPLGDDWFKQREKMTYASARTPVPPQPSASNAADPAGQYDVVRDKPGQCGLSLVKQPAAVKSLPAGSMRAGSGARL